MVFWESESEPSPQVFQRELADREKLGGYGNTPPVYFIYLSLGRVIPERVEVFPLGNLCQKTTPEKPVENC